MDLPSAEILANTLISVVASGCLAVVLYHLRDKASLPWFVDIPMTAICYGLACIGLLLLYVGVVRSTDVWRATFFPSLIAIEGTWLQVKEKGFDTTAQLDIAKRPCSLIRILHDPESPGGYRVEGVTSSSAEPIRFTSKQTWMDTHSKRLSFTYGADARGSLQTIGVTEMGSVRSACGSDKGDDRLKAAVQR